MINGKSPAKGREILSPAGDRESLIAAVRSGADAVYLGVKEFNARHSAENFELSELAETVRYCHIRGVKVYATLNILLQDREIPRAVEVARQMADSGVDAVIVADLGLAAALHRALPHLALHASTQMTVMSPSALLPLYRLGFSQVVLARELSREEIGEICREADRLGMKIEVFVHGALCMCLSGQCLLSAALGGRSGNRGRCAGPCRLPFSVPGGTGYDLSLKDLSLIPYLREMAEMGVFSFKIEGRMKRPEYVAAATAACVSSLKTGQVKSDLSQMLAGVFSRSGFTDGYYTSRTGREMFGHRTQEDEKMSEQVLGRLHEQYRREVGRVPVSLEFSARQGSPACLRISDGTHTVCREGEVPQPALKNPATEESVSQILKKLGTTPYVAEECRVRLQPGLFFKTSALAELRRQVCEELDRLRGQLPSLRPSGPLPTLPEPAVHSPRGFWLSLPDLSRLPKNLDRVAAVLLPIEEQGPLPEIAGKIPFYARLCRGVTREKEILPMLEKCRRMGFAAVVCENPAHFLLAEKAGMPMVTGMGIGCTNSFAAEQLRRMGAGAVLLSPELSSRQIREIRSSAETAVFAYGRLPLMIFKNCPVRNGKTCRQCQKGSGITDRKGVEFPIRCRAGFSELLNSRPVCLADKIGEIAADYPLLFFTDETARQVEEILEAYRNGQPLPGEFTRGMFQKGVL